MILARIEPARAFDLDSIRALLGAAQLPTEGLEECIATALVVRESDRIVGCAALELYAGSALLRSLAVASSHRGHGLGQQLTGAVLRLARRHGITAVYLLTTTADEFFAKHFGFRAIIRSAAPTEVRQSVEFTSACPESARTLILELKE